MGLKEFHQAYRKEDQLQKGESGPAFFVEESTFLQRKEICRQCEWYRKKVSIFAEYLSLDLERCGKCGCPLMSKLKLVHSSCPLNKWGPDLKDD